LTATGARASEAKDVRFGEWVATVRPGGDGIVVSGNGAGLAVARDAELELLFDGVLYNARELRAQLGGAQPARDAYLVLEALRRRGRDVVHELRGQWMLLALDGARNEVFAARDHYGLYGCFYVERSGELLFSPSVEALVRHRDVPRDVNRAALADHLCHRWPVLDETYYEAVRRLPGGHTLTARAGGTVVRRYWHLPPNERRASLTPDEEQERFDELLDRAVERALFAPTAIYLSGGFDSVTVAAFATDIADRNGLERPHALSLAYEHESANEIETQVAVAQRLGLEQTTAWLAETVRGQGLIAAAMAMSARMPAPLLNLWSPAYDQLALEGRRRGKEVVLTGSGGDEWLEYPVYEAELLLKRAKVGALVAAWRSAAYNDLLTTREIARNFLWRYGASPILRRIAGRVLRHTAPGVLAQRRRRRIDEETRDWISRDPALRRALLERYDAYAERSTNILDSAYGARDFEETFERGRSVGLYVAQPFWDVDLTDFLERLPRESLVRGGRSKALVRWSLDKRFPGLGFDTHRKVAATTVYRSLILEEGRRAWRELGGARALVALGVADRNKIERHMQQLLTGSDPSRAFWIWYVLAIEAWLRTRV
jgi:asparagine synthetase B (glutamine-hydrolysing)